MGASGITRRELVQRGGLLALPALLRGRVAAAEPFGATAAPVPAPAVPGKSVGPEIYQSIGVRPFINARGTYTIISGSTHAAGVARGHGRGVSHTTSTSTSWPRPSARASPS